jgi:hypothetical protein
MLQKNITIFEKDESDNKKPTHRRLRVLTAAHVAII